MEEGNTITIQIEISVSPHILGVDQRSYELAVDEGATVRDALLALTEISPGFKQRMGYELHREPPRLPVLVSIHKTTTGYHDTQLKDGDVLYLFPTVFGG